MRAGWEIVLSRLRRRRRAEFVRPEKPMRGRSGCEAVLPERQATGQMASRRFQWRSGPFRRSRRRRTDASGGLMPAFAPRQLGEGSGGATLLLIAVSARSLAQAARRAGYASIAIDAFGDEDARAACNDLWV